jgi:phage-related protein
MSSSFATDFFADDIAKINKEYSDAVNKVAANLQKQMNQIGVNIMNGMAKGMKSKTKNLSKTIQNICNTVIKSAKKKLGIKSPSREFAKIGTYNMLGAEKGHEKEAPKLYRQTENIAAEMAERFASANLQVPDLVSSTKAVMASQNARIASNAKTNILKMDTAGTSIEKTVYTGPEKIEIPVTLDGREVARITAPYMDQRLNVIADRKLRGGV